MLQASLANQVSMRRKSDEAQQCWEKERGFPLGVRLGPHRAPQMEVWEWKSGHLSQGPECFLSAGVGIDGEAWR